MVDTLLRGGTVIDGSGAAAFRAEVLIREDRIVAIGEVSDADCVRDVGGLIVAPGFIDCHSHSDLYLLEDPFATPKVAQGVATEIVGNCGFGPFPLRNDAARRAMDALVPPTTRPAGKPAEQPDSPREFASLADYRSALQRRGTAVNVAALAPHGAIRLSVMGGEDRAATGGELEQMRGLVREAMEQGAAGLSFGLLYAPGCFTPMEEMVALGEIVAPFGRPLAFHGRNECDRLEESVAEAVEIGRQCGAPVHISHLKVADPARWGQVGKALARIDAARAQGQRVTCDQYPYTAGSSPFQTLLPPWSLAGGAGELLKRLRNPATRQRIAVAMAGGEEVPGWDNLSLRIGWDRAVVGSAPGEEGYEGKSLAQLARETGKLPADLVCDLLLSTRGAAIGIWHQMCEEDVRTVLPHPAQMVGSDGLPAPGKPHPRLWGTFPRVLGSYVRELGLLTLEQAIHKMTGRPAATFGLAERGLLRAGYYADVCVFDPARIADRATWEDPTLPPVGLVHVFCNGVATMQDGVRSEGRPGRYAG